VIRLAIIDSGGANIASLRFAIDRLGIDRVSMNGAMTWRVPTIGGGSAALTAA